MISITTNTKFLITIKINIMINVTITMTMTIIIAINIAKITTKNALIATAITIETTITKILQCM